MSEGRIASGPAVDPIVSRDGVRATLEWARMALGVGVLWKKPDGSQWRVHSETDDLDAPRI